MYKVNTSGRSPLHMDVKNISFCQLWSHAKKMLQKDGVHNIITKIKEEIVKNGSKFYNIKQKLLTAFFIDNLLINNFNSYFSIDDNLLSICIDTLVETPLNFQYLLIPTRRVLTLIFSIKTFKYSNDVKNQIYLYTQNFIDKPDMFLQPEYLKNLSSFINFNEEYIRFFRPALIQSITKIMQNLFDYEFLFKIVEFYTEISVLKNTQNNTHNFIFNIDLVGSKGWESVWEIYMERICKILDNFLNIKNSASNINFVNDLHNINIEIMILISLLRSIRNIGYVEISSTGLKNLFNKFLSVISDKNILFLFRDNLQIFLSLILMLISIISKVMRSYIDRLAIDIINIIHYIYEYSISVSDFFMISNSLIAIREFYDVSFMTNSKGLKAFLVRCGVYFNKAKIIMKASISGLASNTPNILALNGKLSEVISYLSERQSMYIESLKILRHALRSSLVDEIQEILRVIIDFSTAFIDLVSLARNGAELKSYEFKCISKISKHVAYFFNDIIVLGFVDLKSSETPINQIVEFLDSFNFKFPSRVTVHKSHRFIQQEYAENNHQETNAEIEIFPKVSTEKIQSKEKEVAKMGKGNDNESELNGKDFIIISNIKEEKNYIKEIDDKTTADEKIKFKLKRIDSEKISNTTPDNKNVKIKDVEKTVVEDIKDNRKNQKESDIYTNIKADNNNKIKVDEKITSHRDKDDKIKDKDLEKRLNIKTETKNIEEKKLNDKNTVEDDVRFIEIKKETKEKENHSKQDSKITEIVEPEIKVEIGQNLPQKRTQEAKFIPEKINQNSSKEIKKINDEELSDPEVEQLVSLFNMGI